MGFSKWTVVIGRTGFVTISSLPDPTLSLSQKREFKMRLMTWRALSISPYLMADFADYEAGGVLRTSARPTSNLLLLLRASSVSMSIHPEGKSFVMHRCRLESLFSMTLL